MTDVIQETPAKPNHPTGFAWRPMPTSREEMQATLAEVSEAWRHSGMQHMRMTLVSPEYPEGGSIEYGVYFEFWPKVPVGPVPPFLECYPFVAKAEPPAVHRSES